MKLTCRYIFYVELYSGVVLFSLIFRVRVRVRVSYRVKVRVYGLRLGLELRLGIDNLKNILKYLIGGAANTLDIPCPQTPVNARPNAKYDKCADDVFFSFFLAANFIYEDAELSDLIR